MAQGWAGPPLGGSHDVAPITAWSRRARQPLLQVEFLQHCGSLAIFWRGSVASEMAIFAIYCREAPLGAVFTARAFTATAA